MKIQYFLKIIILIILALCDSLSYAELKINSVYPTLAISGQPVKLSITGQDMDDTQLSMYKDINYKKIIGSIYFETSEIIVKDNKAYLTYDDRFEVVDIKDLSNPRSLGKIALGGRLLSIRENKAYINSDKILYVVDISQSDNPLLLKTIDLSSCDQNYGTTKVLNVIDNDVYISYRTFGQEWGTDYYLETVKKFDISTSTPFYIKDIYYKKYEINNGSIEYIEIVNDVEYTALGDKGLYISAGGTINTLGYAWKVFVDKDRIYVANGKDGLKIISIEDSKKPKLIGTVASSDVRSVSVDGDNAYLANKSGWLEVIDIRHPVTQQMGFIATPSPALTFFLAKYHESYPSAAHLIYGKFSTDFPLREEACGVYIIDAEDVSKPLILNSFKLNSYPLGFKILYDAFAFVFYIDDSNINDQHDEGVYLYDISSHYTYLIGSFSWGDYLDHYRGINDNKLTVGNISYIPIGVDGFEIKDNNNIIYSYDLSGYAFKVALGYYNTIAFVGQIAYGAGVFSQVSLIDIWDISNPTFITSVDSGGIDRNLGYSPINYKRSLVYNNIEYKILPDGVSGVDTMDRVVAKWNTPPFREIEIAMDGKLYGINDEGLVTFSAEIEFPSVIPIDNTKTSTEVLIKNPGHYNVRVFKGNESVELPVAVTFVPPEDAYLLDAKAIIILGDKSDNRIRTETQTTADFAYQTLLFQGYTAESVNYLSFDTSQPEVDAKASLSSVSDAINTWSIKYPKATELLIYIIGHGEDGYFIINDNERLTAEQLDQWLDDLQNAYDIPVTVIYEACYSGTFLPKLTPPAGKKRVVISSASSELAYFPNSVISFSYQFWNAVYQGNEIGKAFRIAANQMKTYQTALIDADGDGIGTEAEIALAENMKIRRNYKPMTDVPYIYKVSDPQVLHDQTSVKITAGVSYIQDGTKVQRVWATIVPPDFKPDGPVTDLSEIELTDPDGDGVYENIYNEFKVNGTYNIKVCAMNQKGMFALFRDTTVARETGYIAAVSQPQVISQNSAKIWAALKPDIPVSRVWAKIQPPISGVPPTEVKLSDPEHDGIYEAVFNEFNVEGAYAVELYATDTQGYTSPAVPTTISYSSGSGRDIYEQDNTPESARYLSAGQAQNHNFHIAGDTDWIRVFSQKGITYNLGISNQNFCRTSVDFYKQVIPGDVNADNKVDLKDVIAALQIITGLGTSANIFSDVNKDGKIGLEEIVYALRDVSGLNPKTGLKLALLKTSDSAFDWTFSEGGFYYLNVRNTTPDVFGQNVKYDITVSRPIAGSTGTVRGTVKSSSGEPISEAEIFTDSGGSDLSRDNGAFSITDSVGKRIITVQADGYKEYRTAVTLAETEEQVLNIALVPVK